MAAMPRYPFVFFELVGYFSLISIIYAYLIVESVRLRCSMACNSVIYLIVNPDIVWRPCKLRSVYNELRFYIELASPCPNLLNFNSTFECFGQAMLLDDFFIIPKIYCLHRVKFCINTNKKIEQWRWPSVVIRIDFKSN